jgi:hypothetical protein
MRETWFGLGPIYGGADRDRTGGLLVANEALSQLSYSPTLLMKCRVTLILAVETRFNQVTGCLERYTLVALQDAPYGLGSPLGADDIVASRL